MKFHWHNWNLIQTDRIPPAVSSLRGFRTYSDTDTKHVFDAMREKVVYVFKCECGKVKVIKK
jgi:hypothetical protein